MDIKPGQSVTLTVSANNVKPSAAKTLARLFIKDPAIAKKRLSGRKPVDDRRRSGRLWHVIQRGSAAVVPKKGDSATITTTVDIINDINSVAKFVEIR